MKLVTAFAHLENDDGEEFQHGDGVRLLRKVERMARVSHRSEEATTDDSWSRFLRSVVRNHGDWSVAEHASATVLVETDRGITHEWVRHRIGAYTQESTRFVNYTKAGHEARFIVPPDIAAAGRQSIQKWEAAVRISEETYRLLLTDGFAPQIARSVLPTGLASRLYVTYNLRNWRLFFLMRTTKSVHPQMLEITVPLLREFQEKIPILYEDIVPGMSQAEALRLPR